ncbi:MAG: NAD-dependent epimerase/dehydratase family protein [Alphaproteobacteria bacterium]|nr:NAD-dependent epimerase/dehydratase family protein [Alphaproteobacteria bacterium]MBP7758184.1 NAD-dependent epimerase/dehydratase family protein [Alphaproteobacteria bacterium]MBP7761383.1 NAD-dependent epimerase/dehydratase family protein [Alphaproteobacteria bacterium]MBP7905397.1 NAD-dependent epimerase/dehydratase family protein [Alphaproteobacteria bacterium]
MKIAITGGAGFIGTELMTLLIQQGHEVIWLDTRRSDSYPKEGRIVDITDKASLTEALKGIDIIYHLAAEHRDDVTPVKKYYDVNVTGTENLAEAAKINGIKTIIFTSSVAVYGLDAGESKEDSPPAPFNDYGRSKLEGEKVLEKWCAQSSDRRLVSIRLVATFGPGNRGNIFTLMDQIARKRFFMIGNGENRKSVAYVGNVAAFLAECLKENRSTALYNYADKPDLSMKEMVTEIRAGMGLPGLGPRLPYIAGVTGGAVFDTLSSITGRKFPISMIRVKKFCASTVVNADRAASTGFKRPFTLQQGLQEMIASDFAELLNLPRRPENGDRKPDNADTSRKVA